MCFRTQPQPGVVLHAAQRGWQGGAFGLLAHWGDGGVGGGGGGRELFEFDFNGGDVRLQGIFQQAALACVKLLTATPELPALQDRHLVRGLFDLGWRERMSRSLAVMVV